MSVIEYIPRGAAATPITREELATLTGKDDRTIRREINEAKKSLPVINIGRGYYIAEDPDDPNLRAYILQETHRIREISKGLKRHKALYRVNNAQERLNV